MKHEPIIYTLPNKKKIYLSYLYEKELEKLLTVPTTVKQAKDIIKRNRELLEKGYSDVPCPHCIKGYLCYTCAYNASTVNERCTFMCIKDYKFSGKAFEHLEVIYDKLSLSYNEAFAEDIEDEEDVIAFLEGHIEWAKAVIKLGGVAWPDGVRTSYRRDDFFTE